MDAVDRREPQHWTIKDWKQRITTQQWKVMLLHHYDTVSYEGIDRELVAKKLGYGVVEIYKKGMAL
jgi:hypothetical protein